MIDVVLVNYCRPDNFPSILDGFSKQSVKHRITIIDAAEHKNTLKKSISKSVFRYIKVGFNLGSFNRFIPSFVFSSKYVYFHDDDMVPGPLCLSYLLSRASELKNLGVLGFYGRILSSDYTICQKNTPNLDVSREVDWPIRAYFMPSSNLRHVLQTLNRLPQEWRDTWPEDDILLSASMNIAGLSNFIVPQWDDDNYICNQIELDDSGAVCKRPNHASLRAKAVSMLRSIGWQNYASRI